MRKRHIILILIIIILIILIAASSFNKAGRYVKATCELPPSESINHITGTDDFIILTSSLNNNNKIHILDKLNLKPLNNINPGKINIPPVFFKGLIIVDTHNLKKNFINIFEPLTSNLLWKDQYYSKKWSYIIHEDKIYYVDVAGSIKNVNIHTKLPEWKIKIENGFYNSTRPVISGNRFYICNHDQILAINRKNSEVIYNFKIPSKAVECTFEEDIAAILTDEDNVYVVDLVQSKYIWEYKYVSLFSKSTIDIIRDQYLALLNTINLTDVHKTTRGKIITKEQQIIYVIDLFTGQAIWQKGLKYSLDINKLKKYISNNIVVIQTTGGSLTAFNMKSGNKIWRFYNKDFPTPDLPYIIDKDRVIVALEDKKGSKVYVIDKTAGNIQSKIEVPNCFKDSLDPLLDKNNIYLTCKNHSVTMIKLPESVKKLKPKKD
jgi:outer membrane protein assembly factor BamB